MAERGPWPAPFSTEARRLSDVVVWRPLLAVILLSAAPVVAEDLPRAAFDEGAAALQARLDAIARTAEGVHGNAYVAEVITRPTGDYIAILVTALSNDPQTAEVCDSVRRHFLGRLTGAAGEGELGEASAALMQALFSPDGGEGPSAYARELTGKTSLTVALSWRKCAGWLTDWRAVN